ncbi:MAG: hypothetical protein M0P57_11540 [Syntrophales bacterium]|jgi:vacuolar-type H+-ATPase subunit H|nr:hypothetical protein [Syntrophales bacterium]MDY0044187.1 hypothetical protein [Syntrophales bacterium]
MSADAYTSIKDIEAEAEKIIAEANTVAKKRLEEGRQQAKEILSSELPMDEVRNSEKIIINSAEEESKKKVEEAKRRAAKIKRNSASKVSEVVDMIIAHTKGIH